MAAPANTSAFPEKPAVSKEKSQLPEDSDDEDVITSVCPEGRNDESIKTFVVKRQGHTLGNIIRDTVLQNPDVHFCAYSIPHPGERALHLRIQTRPGSDVTANDVLKKALRDIIEMCDDVEEKFTAELENGKYEKT